jgi:signal transduction histidine kinase
LIGEAHAAATSLTFRLSPPALHEIGLVAGLQALAREMHRDHDLRVVVEDDGGPLSLSEAVEFAMYRVVHELLVNVAKHSGRSEARVRAARSGSRLSIAVEDRGAGFDPKAVRSAGMGLRSARERLEYLGGRMRIHSKPGGGTRVELSAPLHVVDPDEPEPGP